MLLTTGPASGFAGLGRHRTGQRCLACEQLWKWAERRIGEFQAETWEAGVRNTSLPEFGID